MTSHKGVINGIKYEVDDSIVDRMRENYNIDAIKEIEDTLSKLNKQQGDTDASKSTTE